MLLEAAQCGDDFTSLNPKMAIHVARAARDTLIAEEHLALSRVQECEAVLTSLCDAVDEVRAWVEDANLQVGKLLNIMNDQGIHIAASIKICMPPPSETPSLTILDTLFPSRACSTSLSYSSGSMDSSGEEGESEAVIFE